MLVFRGETILVMAPTLQVFLDIDIDGELAAFQLGQAFVEAEGKKRGVFFLKSEKLARFFKHLEVDTYSVLYKYYTHTYLNRRTSTHAFTITCIYYILYIKHSLVDLVDNKYVKWTNIENFHVEVFVLCFANPIATSENMQIFFNAYHLATLQKPHEILTNSVLSFTPGVICADLHHSFGRSMAQQTQHNLMFKPTTSCFSRFASKGRSTSS